MRANFDINFEEIFIRGQSNQDNYSAEDFIIFPEGKEKAGGYLCGLIELRATPKAVAGKFLSTLMNTLREEYYGQINSSPEPQKLHLETVFEHALQKTNNRLWELLQIGHFSLPLENLHYLIMAARTRENNREIEIFLAQQGLTHAYLLHKTKKNSLKVVDIVGNTEKIKQPADKLKIFSSIVSGVVYQRDAVYFCSEMFNNYIPPAKINSLLAVGSLPQTAVSCKTLINNVKNDSPLAYAAVFLRLEESKPILDKPLSQKSIDNLLETTEKTEKYLSPSFSLNFRFNPFARIRGRHPANSLKESKETPKIKFGSLKYFLNVLQISYRALGKNLRSCWHILRGRQKVNWRRLFSWRPRLSHTNLWLLAAIVVCAAGFVGSAYYLQGVEIRKQAALEYERQITEIRNKLNDAQVNLIYQNFSQSIALIKDLENKITYLPQATTEQQATHNELADKWQTLRNKLLNIENAVPQLVAEIVKNDQPLTLSAVRVANGKLFVSGAANKIFIIDPLEKKVISEINFPGENLQSLSLEDSSLLAISNDRSVTLFDIENIADTQTPSVAWRATEIADVEYFNGNLYVLDAPAGQIWRHRGAGATFAAGEPWTKDKSGADLGQAVDLTIDGSIYILTRDGTVYRFFNGLREEFGLAALEPPLATADKIYTSPDLDELYILDASDHRLVIFNKNGQFIKQIHFKSLIAAVHDFCVTPDTIYLVADNRLYQMENK